MATTSILITGAGGRMGQTLIAIALEADDLALAGTIDREGSPALGKDAGTLCGRDKAQIIVSSCLRESLASTAGQNPIVIDFTAPGASLDHTRLCAEHGAGLVLGTTGFTDEQDAELIALSKNLPMVKAGNMSTGVTLLSALVEQVAARLDDSFDIEITESHHRHKVDAPSGTALLLGEAAATGRNISLKDNSQRARDGITGARQPGTIGFQAIRGGAIIGDHDVLFAGESETITLSHRALNRGVFAHGAMRAARWLSQNGTGLRDAGHYSMKSVLNL